jgi:hypothetical protein
MIRQFMEALVPPPDKPTFDHLNHSLDLQIGLALQIRPDGNALVDDWFNNPDRDQAELHALTHFAERMRQAMGQSNDHTHKFSITLHHETVTLKYVFTDRDDRFPTIRRRFHRKFRPDPI